MKKMLVLDIDQTLVDSSVRENECWYHDTLDLDKYLSLKKEGIVYDTLLPLGHWLESNAAQYDFVLCTARLFEYIDFESLYSLMPSTLSNAKHIMSRNNALDYGGNTSEASGHYKRPFFNWLKTKYNRDLVVVDDCPKVLQVARESGHHALCARDLWHMTHDNILRVLKNALS